MNAHLDGVFAVGYTSVVSLEGGVAPTCTGRGTVTSCAAVVQYLMVRTAGLVCVSRPRLGGVLMGWRERRSAAGDQLRALSRTRRTARRFQDFMA